LGIAQALLCTFVAEQQRWPQRQPRAAKHCGKPTRQKYLQWISSVWLSHAIYFCPALQTSRTSHKAMTCWDFKPLLFLYNSLRYTDLGAKQRARKRKKPGSIVRSTIPDHSGFRGGNKPIIYQYTNHISKNINRKTIVYWISYTGNISSNIWISYTPIVIHWKSPLNPH
jgi:hypothetical protein